MSRIFTTVAALAATTLLSSAAYAGCNSGTYCGGGSSLSPLSSWSGSSVSAPTYSSGTSYTSGTTSYGSSYGTGSVSSAYAGGNVQMFSGSTASIAGLGSNESLQATNCPVDVYNPTGARVLGCYNVVKQVPQTNYVRVVRPIIYVRTPVPTPVAVPYYVNVPQSRCGAQNVNYSRYLPQQRNSCGNRW